MKNVQVSDSKSHINHDMELRVVKSSSRFILFEHIEGNHDWHGDEKRVTVTRGHFSMCICFDSQENTWGHVLAPTRIFWYILAPNIAIERACDAEEIT